MSAEHQDVVKALPTANRSVVVRLAERFGVDATKMMSTLKATAFKGNASDEQLMALCVVADQYGLNPWTKEIYAFPSQNGIIPVVGVDGWSRIINTHPQFDGMDYIDGPADDKGLPEWIECAMHRKDRAHAVKVREYMVECYRDVAGPWKSHPRRMLRHKATIQCARLAFGFAGIFDLDEAERIIDVTPADLGPRPDTSEVNYAHVDKWIGDITDCMAQDKEEWQIAASLRELNAELSKYPELYTVVFDQLAARKIITKSNFKKYLEIKEPVSG